MAVKVKKPFISSSMSLLFFLFKLNIKNAEYGFNHAKLNPDDLAEFLHRKGIL